MLDSRDACALNCQKQHINCGESVHGMTAMSREVI